jgi:hypothetical protein
MALRNLEGPVQELSAAQAASVIGVPNDGLNTPRR